MSNCTIPPYKGPEEDEDESGIDNQELHHALMTIIFGSALLLNLLLYVIILFNSRSLKFMKPMFQLCCFIDILMSCYAFLVQPVMTTSYGYYSAFLNGFIHTNESQTMIIAFICGTINMINWACLPLQFLYRLVLVKTSRPPKGPTLFAIIVFTVVSSLVYTYLIYGLYMYKTQDDFDQIASTIVKRNGFTHHIKYFVGARADEPRFQTLLMYSSGHTLFGYLTIVLCQIGISQSLRAARKSNIHVRELKRNKEVNNALIALGACPFFTSFLPSIFIATISSACTDMGAIPILLSILSASSAVVNPITTIIFVSAYRRALLQMFRPRQHTSIGANSSSQGRFSVVSRNLNQNTT